MAMLEGLLRAHRDQDAVAIAACYAPAAIICDLSPPLSHHGIDLKATQSWPDSWDGPITLEPQEGL